MPDIEGVIRAALQRRAMPLDDPWCDEALRPIHRRHVVGYLRRLAGRDEAASQGVVRRWLTQMGWLRR